MCPASVQPEDLLTTEVDSVKALTVSFVNNWNTAMIVDWRLVNKGSSTFINPYWPIPVSLAYTDADSTIGGTLGEPVGYLNWFPAAKASLDWDKKHAELETEQITDDPIKNHNSEPGAYALNQNYPNPFNPTTVIGYQLLALGHVTLKIYDVLGRELATRVNENESAG